MAANEQAMWQKLLSTMASIESHLAQAKQARAQGDVDKAAGKSQEANYQAKQYDKLVEALKTVNEEAQTYQEAGERALAILRDQLAIQKDLDKLGVTTAAALVENIQKQIKAQEQLNKNQEKSDKVIKSIFKTTLGITDLKMEDTGLGTLLNPAVWSNIGKSVKETFTLSKIADNY